MLTTKLKQTAIIFILALSIVHPLFNMSIAPITTRKIVSRLCTTFNWSAVVIPIIDALFVEKIRLKQEKQGRKIIKSNAPKKIIKLVKQEAEKRNLYDIRCCIKEDSGEFPNYSVNQVARIIYIPKTRATELEKLLNTETQDRTSEKQMSYNNHLSSLHHELTHIERQNKEKYTKAKIAAATIAQGLDLAVNQIITRKIPLIKNSFWLNNMYKLTGGITKLLLINNLTYIQYQKYEELKADDGIPNQKELLETMANKYKECHDNQMLWVNVVKNNCTFIDLLRIKLQHKYFHDNEKFVDENLNLPQLILIKLIPENIFNKSPLLNDICFDFNSTHPSFLRRAMRFRKCIEQLN